MITFSTPTALPIEAATTMGVSVKEDGAIGKFGTGLKYAIAGVLRLGGSLDVTVEGENYAFTAVESDIRGRTFRIVHCNGQPCGFTTDLGKHWEPWQLFRELASNALDEGGTWVLGEDDAVTTIRVRCREVEEAGESEDVFLGKRTVLLASSNGATIYQGPSRHYYYKGIRAGSFNCIAPVTVDVSDGALSEDRLLDLSVVQNELGWAFRSATSFDEQLVLSVIRQDEPGSFWVENLSSYTLDAELPAALMSFLADQPKFVMHPGFQKALARHLKLGKKGRWTEVWPSQRHTRLLEAGELMCRSIGVDVIPRDKAKFTQDLDDKTLAVTCMDTRAVWFSTKLALLGRDEFLCGYLEEAIHAMTGHADCTRALQNTLLSIIVAQASKDESF